MTAFVFPDNTVLVNFTLIDRHDLVEWITRGQGRWGITVCRECSNSARTEGLARMHEWRGVFGNPLAPTPAEIADAHLLVEQMKVPGEGHPGKHMGEAETVAIVTRRCMEAIFLTDDAGAARVARAHRIPVRSTRWIIAMAEAAQQITPEQAREFLDLLHHHQRFLGSPPRHHDYDLFVRRLQQGR